MNSFGLAVISLFVLLILLYLELQKCKTHSQTTITQFAETVKGPSKPVLIGSSQTSYPILLQKDIKPVASPISPTLSDLPYTKLNSNTNNNITGLPNFSTT